MQSSVSPYDGRRTRRKYGADNSGLQYTTAETHDLANNVSILICDLAFKSAAVILGSMQEENERLAERIGELTRESLL